MLPAGFVSDLVIQLQGYVMMEGGGHLDLAISILQTFKAEGLEK